MIPGFRLPISFFSSLFLVLLLLSGCSSTLHTDSTLEQKEFLTDEENIPFDETPDHSCSYFYFLLAKHAENKEQYSAAQEAYEKALICDPESTYIVNKLPLLLIKMGKYQGAAKWLRELLDKNPEDISNRLLLAQIDVRIGEVDEAIQLYKKVIELQPEDETTLLRLGVLFSKELQYKKAKESFMQALSLNQESFFTHFYLARLATQTGEYEMAENWYKEALLLNWSSELAIELADFYKVLDKQEQAEALYRSILEKIPNDEQAGLGLVQSLLIQEKETDALEILQELLETSDDPERIILITCRIYLRSGDFDKAEELLKDIVINNDEAAYILAVIYYEQKNIEQTLQTLLHIESGSDFYQDRIVLQVRILMEAKQDQQAISFLHTVLANEADSSPELYALLASLYIEKQQLQNSYETLDKGLLVFPDSEQLYFEYGLLLEQDGKQEQAIKSMEHVLEIEPEHAEALNYLGYTWANNNTNLDKALEYILRSISLKPGNGYIQDSLGWVYFRRGELDKAITEMLTAIELEPKDPHIFEHLGDIYKEKGKEKEALKAYQQAEKLSTDEEQKNRILDKLRELQRE